MMAQPWPAWVHDLRRRRRRRRRRGRRRRGRSSADLPPSSRNTFLMVSAAGGHDPPPGGGRAGERHDVDPGVGGELPADVVSAEVTMLTTPAGMSVSSATSWPSSEAGPRRVGRRLQHHGVAGGERRRHLGQVDLVGEVPRRDRRRRRRPARAGRSGGSGCRSARRRRGPAPTRSARPGRRARQELDGRVELRAVGEQRPGSRPRRRSWPGQLVAWRSSSVGAAGAGTGPGARRRSTSRSSSNARRAAAIAGVHVGRRRRRRRRRCTSSVAGLTLS